MVICIKEKNVSLMHTNMKVVMLDTVTDVKKKKKPNALSLFLPSLSHTVELTL